MTCPKCGGIVRPKTPQQEGFHWHCYQKEKQNVLQPMRRHTH